LVKIYIKIEMVKNHDDFMREAIKLSVENINNGGGPFGAIIVKDGEIVAKGVNRVTPNTDPTAHAEVMAIREAAQKLNDFNLSGCTIYTSCEPCPMCLSAIYWARIDNIYFGNTKIDAKNIGFDDSFIYDEIALPMEKRKIKTLQILRDEANEGFKKWENFEGKLEY
jgi:guanine deaminase